MIHEKLSGEIIGAAMAVLNELCPGLDEKLYERALVIELRKRGHTVDQQRAFPVHYSGELIGSLVPDAIVDGLVIADPKVVETFGDTHVRADDRLPCDYQTETRATAELQICKTAMKACDTRLA